MTIAAPPAPTSTQLSREVVTDRGVVLVDDRTTPDGWVLSPTGHELDGPWVSPLSALDAAAGHAARP